MATSQMHRDIPGQQICLGDDVLLFRGVQAFEGLSTSQ